MKTLGFGVLTALALAAGRATPSWTVTDIGTPAKQPAAFMTAVALNNHGELIGNALLGSFGHRRQEAFTWRNGRFDLLRYPGSTWITVVALNTEGTVIGTAGGAPVVWRHGTPARLGSLGGRTSPTALNDHDQVVGSSVTAGGATHAFLWQNGTMTDLGTLGGATSQATAINDRGQIIGTSTTASGFTHAFVWQDDTMTDLGSVPGADSIPLAIDDGGEIVGETRQHDVPWSPLDAVLWRNGKLVDLGRFGSPNASAVAVNDSGDVLIALDRGDEQQSALLLHGTMQLRIRSLGATAPAGQGASLLTVGLNDNGQVLGFGYTRSGARRIFIWQNGTTTLLRTFDGVEPPWGFPVALNSLGVAVGTVYGPGSGQHIAVWRPSRR